MSKLKIADAAIKLGVSKEAIHNRIRRGSLESVIEDGVKFVILDASSQKTTPVAKKRTPARSKPSPQADSKYYKFLEEQNEKLQSKVEKLEGETRDLRDQKEQMLIEERQKIEQIYKDKDEQLKNILSTISSNFLLNTPKPQENITPPVEVEIEEPSVKEVLISLKKYLNNQKIKDKKQQKIKSRFEKVAKNDKRFIRVGKKLYLNLAKYDYSDLLSKWA